MKISRILKIATLVILLCFIIIAGYVYFNVPISSKYFIKEKNFTEGKELTVKLSKEEVEEDVKQIIEIVEETHPVFIDEEDKDIVDEYNKKKQILLENTNKEMTVEDFDIELSKYLSSLNDGHTRVWWYSDEVLNVSWKYINDKLMLVDENNKLTNKEVIKINDVDIKEIINNEKKIFPSENYAAEKLNVEQYSKDASVLKYSGIDISKNVVLSIKENDGSVENININFIKNYEENNEFKISWKNIDEDIFYTKFNMCDVNDDFTSMINDMKKAVDNGACNVIVDVRGNPGGNSLCGDMILETLKMKGGRYGVTIRFSDFARDENGYIRNSGTMKSKPKNNAVKNDKINLYVLTDGETFSSATMLAVWVQDGHLGKIVGSASSNKPSCYGDIIRFQLNNSKIGGQVSFKKWKRPDASKDDEPALEPDIKVSDDENPINVVLHDIRNKY